MSALLFDLDGTLVDSAAQIAAALSAVRIARGGDAIDAGTVRPWISDGAGTLVARALGPLAGPGDSDLAEFRRRLRAVVPEPAAVYPGVGDALGRLAAGGWRMAVVTNKPEALARRLLQQLGLLQRFDAVVGGDTLPVAKPDPAPLRHASTLLGTGRAAWLVGDSGVDGAAAQAAGIRFALFTGGYGAGDAGARGADARFADFAALPGIVGPARRAA